MDMLVSAPFGIQVSIVVPVKDEEAAVAPFVARMRSVLDALFAAGKDEQQWEILFIDDGSGDLTLARIHIAHCADPRIKAVSLSRNFGKEAALSAGLDHALGRAVIPIDVDLQDPPEVVGEMIAKWRQGYEVVYGVRRDRGTDSLPKRLTAGLYYRAHNWLSPDKIPEHAGDFRLLDRVVVDAIRRLPERNRFMKGLFAWSGFRQTAVEYEREPRRTGRTKFRYWKLWALALDGITSASTAPLRIWSYVGVFSAALAIIAAATLTLSTLAYGNDVPGYASLMVTLLFFSGLQLISLGILGEYVGRILIETKQRPIYIVRDLIGLGKGD